MVFHCTDCIHWPGVTKPLTLKTCWMWLHAHTGPCLWHSWPDIQPLQHSAWRREDDVILQGWNVQYKLYDSLEQDELPSQSSLMSSAWAQPSSEVTVETTSTQPPLLPNPIQIRQTHQRGEYNPRGWCQSSSVVGVWDGVSTPCIDRGSSWKTLKYQLIFNLVLGTKGPGKTKP